MVFSRIINSGRSCWVSIVEGDRFTLRNHLPFNFYPEIICVKCPLKTMVLSIEAVVFLRYHKNE